VCVCMYFHIGCYVKLLCSNDAKSTGTINKRMKVGKKMFLERAQLH